MNYLATIFSLAQAIGFKFQDLTERRVQEHGVSVFGTFSLYKYALIPAILWAVIFVRISDVLYIIHTPTLLGYLLFIAVVWNMQAFLFSYMLNTTSSMSALTTLQYLIYLPLLLVVGMLFNHDHPNVYNLLSILSLLFAFVIQPAQHRLNIRSRFSMPVIYLVGIVVLKSCIDAANNGVSREALAMLSPQVFLGVFSVITIGLCALCSLFLPRTSSDEAILRKRRWLALAIPFLWFAASIPETWSFAELPIYTVVSIGAITFALDTASDLYHRRVRLNFRTGIFMLLTLAGMALAVFSV